jgi:hypothetical protein
MLHHQRITALVIALFVAWLNPVQAQIDYRNLDDHRPVRTEDAYPIERHAFELIVPYEYDNERGGEQRHVLAPEISYGVLRNMQVGMKLPFAAVSQAGGTDWGFAGARLLALYNFNTEGLALPGFSLRADLALPGGSLAGDDPQITLKAIATRSWGRTRAHLNGEFTLGPEAGRPDVNAARDWMASVALDRTFLRSSLLVIAEVGAGQAISTAPTEVTTAWGFRYQLSPTLVLDAGMSRRLSADAGPDLGLTLGLSHAFGLAGIFPGK